MTGDPMHTTSKERTAPHLVIFSYVQPVHNIKNEERYEKCLSNQSGYYRKYGLYPLQK